MPIIIDKMPVLIDKLVIAIADNLPKLIEMGIRLIIMLAKGIVKSLPNILQAQDQIFVSFINGAGRYFNNMMDLGGRMLNKIKEGLLNGIYSIADVGHNIVQGLWNGIVNAKDWLINKVKNLAKSLLDGMKSALGIHSPSKVFQEQVGRWIPEGVAIGIEANTDSALESIDKMNNEMLDKMSSAVNLETSKMSFSGIKGSVTDILNANSVIKVENYNTLELDGEKVYENQKTIQKQKNLQYGFGGVQ